MSTIRDIIKSPRLPDEAVRGIVSAMLGTLRLELAAIGIVLDDNFFADLANTVRPLLNLALRFDVERAIINDHRPAPPNT